MPKKKESNLIAITSLRPTLKNRSMSDKQLDGQTFYYHNDMQIGICIRSLFETSGKKEPDDSCVIHFSISGMMMFPRDFDKKGCPKDILYVLWNAQPLDGDKIPDDHLKMFSEDDDGNLLFSIKDAVYVETFPDMYATREETDDTLFKVEFKNKYKELE